MSRNIKEKVMQFGYTCSYSFHKFYVEHYCLELESINNSVYYPIRNSVNSVRRSVFNVIYDRMEMEVYGEDQPTKIIRI